MLQAAPTSWWGSRYAVRDDGEPLTELAFTSLREGGGFTLGGVPYTLRREGVAGNFVLQDPSGVAAAQARKESAFRRRFELEHPGGGLRVESTSVWGRSYRVLGPEGRQLGEVRWRSFWRREVDATLPDDLPRHIQVFVLWLVLLMIRRDEAAATST
jgi:hypothetical protein